jgi:hypothetical protein
MVTGGFRTRTAMQQALADGELDVIGLGRPLVTVPGTPSMLLDGNLQQAAAPEATIDVFAAMPWFSTQLTRLANGGIADAALTAAAAVAEFGAHEQSALLALLARRGG